MLFTVDMIILGKRLLALGKRLLALGKH